MLRGSGLDLNPKAAVLASFVVAGPHMDLLHCRHNDNGRKGSLHVASGPRSELPASASYYSGFGKSHTRAE